MQDRSLSREEPLEEGMATHSSILAWRIPWTEEPGGLQSIGSQRVGHNYSDLTHMHAHIWKELQNHQWQQNAQEKFTKSQGPIQHRSHTVSMCRAFLHILDTPCRPDILDTPCRPCHNQIRDNMPVPRQILRKHWLLSSLLENTSLLEVSTNS